MKKIYIPVEIEIAEFDTEDIITTSGLRSVFEFGDSDETDETNYEDGLSV